MRTLKCFLAGLTAYPFPNVVPRAFDGWTNEDMRAYMAGLVTLSLSMTAGMVIAIAPYLTGA